MNEGSFPAVISVTLMYGGRLSSADGVAPQSVRDIEYSILMNVYSMVVSFRSVAWPSMSAPGGYEEDLGLRRWYPKVNVEIALPAGRGRYPKVGVVVLRTRPY